MKKRIDWEAAEKDYRLGLLNEAAIAKKYGCSRAAVWKHMKVYHIRRDLKPHLRNAIAKKVAKRVAKQHTPAAEQAIINDKADEIQALLESHRQDIKALRDLEAKLIKEIYGEPKKLWIGQHQGIVMEHEYGIPATERAQAAASLATVQTKRIALERQAYSIIDEAPDADKDYHIHVTYAKGPESYIR